MSGERGVGEDGRPALPGAPERPRAAAPAHVPEPEPARDEPPSSPLVGDAIEPEGRGEEDHPYGKAAWLPPAPRSGAGPTGSPGAHRAPTGGTPERERRGLFQRLGAGVAGLVALLLKFGGLLIKLKFIGTAFTALISVGAYALFFGWKFAALIVLLLFVHEMGHVVQLRLEGVDATAPMFIPFLGAVVGMKELPKNAWVEAKVALAGPVFGAIGSAVTLALADHFDSDLLRVVAYFSFFINLFNLAPVTPLDGGRAAAALHPAFWLVGLFGLVGFAFIHFSPFLLFIGYFAATDTWRRWREFRVGGEAAKAYYAVSAGRRAIVVVTLVAVALACIVGMDASYTTR